MNKPLIDQVMPQGDAMRALLAEGPQMPLLALFAGLVQQCIEDIAFAHAKGFINDAGELVRAMPVRTRINSHAKDPDVEELRCAVAMVAVDGDARIACAIVNALTGREVISPAWMLRRAVQLSKGEYHTNALVQRLRQHQELERRPRVLCSIRARRMNGEAPSKVVEPPVNFTLKGLQAV